MGAFTGMDTESVRQLGEVLMDRAQTIQHRIDGLRDVVDASSTFWETVEVDARTAAYEQGSGLSVEEFKRIRDKP